MTRVNLAIKPSQLSDQLLLNALGEEPRILTSVIARIDKDKPFNDIPFDFRMGAGHMKFFFDKCLLIFNRYCAMRYEYNKRFGKEYSEHHYNDVMEKYSYIKNVRPELCNDYTASLNDRKLVFDRIMERSKGYKKAHTYYGVVIDDWESVLNK